MHKTTPQCCRILIVGGLLAAWGAAGCVGTGNTPQVPSGLQLAIADGDHVRIVDPATGAELYDVTSFGEVKRLAYRPDGSRLAVGHCFQNRVAELDTATYSTLAEPIAAASCPWQVAYSPNGLDLAALRPFRPSPSAALTDHFTVVGASPVDQNLGRPLVAMAYRPGGAEFAVATPQGLKVLSASGTYPTLHHFPTLAAGQLAYSIDGARLFAATSQGLAVLSAAAGYQPLQQVATGAVTALAVDPSGHWLAIATPAVISIRRAIDLVEVASFTTTGVRDLDFSRDGSTLAAGEADGDVRLFTAPDWLEASAIAATDRVSEIAFRPTGFPRVPVLFIHGHSRPPSEVWFEDGGGTAFGTVLSLNPDLNIDAFHLELPLHGSNYPQNQGRGIGEDVDDILAAIEGGADSHGAVQVGILNMPDYQTGGRTAMVSYSQGTLSARGYLKDRMGDRSNGAITVNEFVTLAAANHGVGSPIACTVNNANDRALRQLCAGRRATLSSSTGSCGSCGQQPPNLFGSNLPGDDTFIADLNGHPLGTSTSCSSSFQAASMAPSSRPTTDPTGVLYVNVYATQEDPLLQRDILAGGAPQHGDCLGRRVAHNFAPDAVNFSVSNIPVDVHQNLPHEPEVVCTALRSVVDHQAPASTSQACQGLTLP